MKFDYVNTLPRDTIKCESLEDLARLKKNKRKWKKGNLEPDYGRVYYVYSISSKVYWKRTVQEYTDFIKLKQYIRDGNVYAEEKQTNEK